MAIYSDGKHNENMEHVSKREYDFYIDKKISMWVREMHTIKADNEEQAKEMMINKMKDSDTDDTFYEEEEIYDTQEYLTPEDNSNQATEELYYKGEFITDNLGNTEI